MPSSIAAVKPKITSGPTHSSTASAISIVKLVITVRASVSLMLRSSSGMISILRYFFRFSRMRS